MKKNIPAYIIQAALALFTTAAISSCDLTKTNVNPNASSDVSVSAVLTGAQVSQAFSLGVDDGLITNIYIQQVAGSNGDAASFDNYSTAASYFNATWGNLYVGVLDEYKIVQQTATAQSLPYYRGIARILSAYGYATLTDIFGNIPYTQSLYGNDVTNPTYDSQESIYTALQTQLDSAITDLSQPGSANLGAVPSSDDVIFSGNISKWLATAWTLKARYALHQSKLNPTTAAQQVLSYLYNGTTWRGIASYSNDAQVTFGSSATNANPYYQQNSYRPGWIGLGKSFVNLLNGNKTTDANTTAEGTYVDPRRAYFATQYPTGSGKYQGSNPGVSGAFSVIGSYYGSATSPVVFTSYSEAKFLEAEARIILNPSDPLAQTALQAAVQASFSKVISSTTDAYATAQKQADYIAARATLTGNYATDLETIITQKYIALFLQPEVWTDYRRTGYPALPLAVNGTNSANPEGKIPRRIPYPQNEQSLNKNTPAGSGYQTPRLWWDQ